MSIKLIFFVLVGFISRFAHAECVAITRGLDECFRCCKGTAQAAELKRDNSELLTDVSAVCATENGTKTVNLASKSARDLRNKYKIDSSTLYILCANSALHLAAAKNEDYVSCAKSCGTKFPSKNPGKQK